MKIIEIVVSTTGQTQVATKGFAGAECRRASEFVEKALGQRTGEQLTGEFYQTQAQQETLQLAIELPPFPQGSGQVDRSPCFVGPLDIGQSL